MTPTEKIADFVVNTNFDSFPEEAIHLGKRLFLDCLGVALAAKSEPVVQKATRLIKAQGGKKEARVWGQSISVPLPSAAFLNATMAHALDFDDSAFSHPTAILLPTAMALGEKLELAGAEVLASILIGYEVFGTLSLSSNQKLLRQKGWHPTPILGTMAAAATAAKLMRLPEKELRMALGIAGSSAGGLGQNFGTMTKPLHAGFSARNGLLAAQMAREGITADGHILEAERGYGNAFFGPDGHELGKVDQVLGPPYKIITPGINIKPYPCCRGAHRSIDCALALKKQLQVQPEEIQSIEADLHLDGPTLYHYPRTSLEGKFSIAYCISTALIKGKVRLEEFDDQNLTDPVLQDLMKKVANVRKPDPEEIVTIFLKDGRSFSHKVEKAKGDAKKNPLTDEEVAEKFKDCAKGVLGGRNTSTAVQQIGKLEKVRNLRQLLDRIMA